MLGPPDLEKEVLATFPREANPILSDGLLSRIRDSGYRFRDVREVGGPNRRDLVVAAALGLGVAIGPFSMWDMGEAAPLVIRRAARPAAADAGHRARLARDAAAPARTVLAAARKVARGLRGAGAETPPTSS